ncbi:hypothetical protein DFH08DRAFT_965706 [Mycena albidolilacea]|uniref:Uncharacterized protein n=1 Tax=Mycena albidolilacea TaxID=1033008 RepID=A0AAD6ZQ04_9AGAR|nr:hypothetical protein DFH08DRAFT_965706 [Mycena albidolilacea]
MRLSTVALSCMTLLALTRAAPVELRARGDDTACAAASWDPPCIMALDSNTATLTPKMRTAAAQNPQVLQALGLPVTAVPNVSDEMFQAWLRQSQQANAGGSENQSAAEGQQDQSVEVEQDQITSEDEQPPSDE